MARTLRIGSDMVGFRRARSAELHLIPENILGIGLEVHEAPYLRGGSNDVIETGHSFSDEPGVYIEGKVCDCIFQLVSPDRSNRSGFA